MILTGGEQAMTALNDLRKAKGMSTKELTERAGISESFFWYLCEGKKKPSLKTLHKLSEVLGVSMEKLAYIFLGKN